MSWLNYSLIAYSSKKRILPDTQVAAQPGVQTRDLMSFLAGVKCWSHRNKQPVYALKRDQMKGFDYLAPQGFYDAISAYGLPDAIADLDRAAQTDTRCFIRTAYGITDPIIVTGVTKQGGPLSPLKSTFTTSLGHYFMDDIVRVDNDALTLTTTSMKKGDPHIPDAKTSITLAMVEATDDSFIFSRSLKSLQSNTLAMERFQYAYVDNPSARYHEILELINTFQFPRTVTRPPITLLRKIISQNLISRIRAYLTLQPIKHTDAEKLDRKVIERVHNILGFPFRPNTNIATLPLSLHGFDFPSIARINQAIAVAGIGRDLNHHIQAYRSMARITLVDWTCEKNDCQCPLNGNGLDKDFGHYGKSLPAAWIIAQKTMRSLNPPLVLRPIDQSYWTNGDVSLSHLISLMTRSVPDIKKIINGTALLSLRAKGIRALNDVGWWESVSRDNDTNHQFWASDGSMVPATAGITEMKSITGAATGDNTLVMKTKGRNLSILHGELVGLILALVLSQDQMDSTMALTLLTDHLNSVRIIQDSRSSIDQAPRLRNMNGRSDNTIEAQMNNEADHYASRSQQISHALPTFQPPTFFMNDYTFYREEDGYIESSITHFIETYTAISQASELAIGHGYRMVRMGYDATSPPPYPYVRAVSAHSAAVQLYARSGQLATASVLHARGKIESPACALGCTAFGDAHHLFVNCKVYETWRMSESKELQRETERKLGLLISKDAKENDNIKKVVEEIMRIAKSLFRDDPMIWPHLNTSYYLGNLPCLSNVVSKEVIASEILRRRITTNITMDWHTRSIKLAGRIFGDYQKRMAVTNGCRRR
ncbi:hypothetical protein HYPSUDRAFT_130807 [Hypholoma sublateritium FD-334 SS-4]|uniref:Reverse transcriptase domain-containing protein n=1 Tax=Hypholoma sublateritium (strain FD-334 SS-4) TaxID=945553 RepID=A0A0D2Q7D0_HYPSF|nr:hypothetical protein HYPSUDRAFT_130807 [Hypholoma sublateritium FD-334 SS-4]